MDKKEKHILFIIILFFAFIIGVLNTPPFSGRALNSSYDNPIVLNYDRVKRNEIRSTKTLNNTIFDYTHGLTNEEIYQLNNKHIMYLKTNNDMFASFFEVPDEECFLNNDGEYVIRQTSIGIYYKNYWHGIKPAISHHISPSSTPYSWCQVRAYLYFFPTTQQFDKNLIDFKFYTSSSDKNETIIIATSNGEDFAYIRYYRRYIKIDDYIILNTIIDNLIII